MIDAADDVLDPHSDEAHPAGVGGRRQVERRAAAIFEEGELDRRPFRQSARSARSGSVAPSTSGQSSRMASVPAGFGHDSAISRTDLALARARAADRNASGLARLAGDRKARIVAQEARHPFGGSAVAVGGFGQQPAALVIDPVVTTVSR